ncbi:hypothetical protein [Yoonia sp. SS1-5]|uniref:Uncharacterized protein n=1 Tax=Yoonia rhodophyticola TaxID=3137370 RepID=A0AAN0MB11_9RHOB
MGGLSFEERDTNGDETTTTEVELGGFALLGDYFPTQSGWRISGGLMFATGEANALVEGDIEVNGTVYPGETLEIAAVFNNEIAPMITTGYDWRFGNGWSFNSEIGAVFIDGITLTATSSNTTAQAEIENDPDYQQAQQDAADVAIAPYLAFGVSYEF